MPNIFLRQDFSPSCPSGGNWYACGTGSSFVGCCNSEPCDNGCPDGNLEPASFNPAWFGKFPDQECPTGSLWYTCQDTNPPFMGCCKSSPCGTGCLAGNLTAGFLSSNPALAAKFSPSPALSAASTTIALSSSDSDTSSSTTIPPISQTASARPTSLSMSTVTSTPVNGASSDSTGQHLPHHSNSRFIIAGCVIGGTLVFFILLLLYCYRRKRINKRKKAPGQPSSGYNGGIGTEVSPHDLKQSSIHESSSQTPLPSYELDTPPAPRYPPRYSSLNEKANSTASAAENRHAYELASPSLPSSLQTHSDGISPIATPNGLGVMVPATESPSPSRPLLSPRHSNHFQTLLTPPP